MGTQFQVQTRSEKNGLCYFASLAEAIDYAEEKDTTVWKVSFSLPNGERVRLEKNHNDDWIFAPMPV